jgi:hypothetical protein
MFYDMVRNGSSLGINVLSGLVKIERGDEAERNGLMGSGRRPLSVSVESENPVHAPHYCHAWHNYSNLSPTPINDRFEFLEFRCLSAASEFARRALIIRRQKRLAVVKTKTLQESPWPINR